MAVGKITEVRSSRVLPSYLKQVWDYLKYGLVFTVITPFFSLKGADESNGSPSKSVPVQVFS